MIDRNEAIKRIRAALKRRSGKQWSVTGDKGTAWSWINIDVPPSRRTWHYVQTKTPEAPNPAAIYGGASGLTPAYYLYPGAEDPILRPEDDPWAREALEAGRTVLYSWEVYDPTKEFGHASPADRIELGKLLGLGRPAHHQGESVPLDSREWYVKAAEGVQHATTEQ